MSDVDANGEPRRVTPLDLGMGCGSGATYLARLAGLILVV
jgi:hypothetical protein